MYCITKHLSRSRLGIRNEALLFLHVACGPTSAFPLCCMLIAFNDPFSLSEAKRLALRLPAPRRPVLEVQLTQVGLLG